MMKKNVVILFFLMTFCSLTFAQTAESVTEALNSKTVNLAQVSYFATAYLELGSADISYDDAAILLEESIGFPSIKNPQESLTYKEFSYFCTRVWNIENTLMYLITKAPRYALVELKLLGYIPSTIDPDAVITGRDALSLMTQCAEYAEANGTLEKDK